MSQVVLQIDEQTFRRLLEENESLQLLDKIGELELKLRHQETINREIAKENSEMRAANEKLNLSLKLARERRENVQLEKSESQILKMKLQHCENAKENLIKDFEKEKIILEGLLRDNSKLKLGEINLEQARNEIASLRNELETTRAELERNKLQVCQLDEAKLTVEQILTFKTEKLRMLEEKHNRDDLADMECKLLRMKLREMEKERNQLADDIEKERRLMTRLQKNTPIYKIEENLKGLKKWLENKGNREEVLIEQISRLEAKQKDLVEGFQMERDIFHKVLETKPL